MIYNRPVSTKLILSSSKPAAIIYLLTWITERRDMLFMPLVTEDIEHKSIALKTFREHSFQT